MTDTGSDADLLSPVAATDRLVLTVVETVADAEGVDPSALDPLYTAIDPDVLDLFVHPVRRDGGPDTTGEIRFEYHGHEVRVTAEGQVSVVDDGGARRSD